MRIELDFNSPEAIYIQLRNQIVMQIAQEQLRDGDSLLLYVVWQENLV